MSSMRAGDDVYITLTPAGEAALDKLAEALAATYDGSTDRLDRLMRYLRTTDVDDLASDLSVVANDLLPVDAVARRRLDAPRDGDVSGTQSADRQIPPHGW
ncbi:hypothetical protein [Nocardioides ultimimeridianus]